MKSVGNLSPSSTSTFVTCPTCFKEFTTDPVFCIGCDTYLPHPGVGCKASLGSRAAAILLDSTFIFLLSFLFFFGPLGIIAAIGLLFYSLLLFTEGRTLGKKAMGLQVVSRRDGVPLNFLLMLLREWPAKWVSSFFFGLGFFWIILDRDSQGWHDKIAGSVVLRTRR